MCAHNSPTTTNPPPWTQSSMTNDNLNNNSSRSKYSSHAPNANQMRDSTAPLRCSKPKALCSCWKSGWVAKINSLKPDTASNLQHRPSNSSVMFRGRPASNLLNQNQSSRIVITAKHSNPKTLMRCNRCLNKPSSSKGDKYQSQTSRLSIGLNEKSSPPVT